MQIPDWRNWLRTARPVQDTVHLGRRYLYILPTRHGLLLGLVLVAMLIGAINYTLSLGFVLTFLLAGLGIVAMLHTWRNLAHLSLSSGKIAPVFAGEPLQWPIILKDHHQRPRHAICLQHGASAPRFTDVPVQANATVTLAIPTSQRGWLVPDRVRISTEFPLGLFHAWSYAQLAARGLVYPTAAAPGTMPPQDDTSAGQGHMSASHGDEDFSGLRTYRTGDNPSRIDWKASSRERGLMTKQFEGSAHPTQWLDWRMTAGDVEQRLSQLARWVLDAEEEGRPYGLRLPGNEIPAGQGALHRHRCLEALALFQP